MSVLGIELVCKGDLSLGTGCKKCSRCRAQREELDAKVRRISGGGSAFPESGNGKIDYVLRPTPSVVEPIRAVRWTGINLDRVREVFPGIGEEYMRDKGCSVGDWVVSQRPGMVRFWPDETFRTTYMPVAELLDREIRPATFTVLDSAYPCTAWSDGVHIIADGKCRCGMCFRLVEVRP